MEIPSQVKIGPFTWRIEWVPDLTLEGDELPRAGVCDYASCTIRLRAGMDPQLAFETLLHESLHALDDFMETNLRETQINRLSPAILMFLRDNDLLRESVE